MHLVWPTIVESLYLLAKAKPDEGFVLQRVCILLVENIQFPLLMVLYLLHLAVLPR